MSIAHMGESTQLHLLAFGTGNGIRANAKVQEARAKQAEVAHTLHGA
jgi:hypothetical protein